MEVGLPDTLTVVPLRVGQAKQPLLEKGASTSQPGDQNNDSGSDWPYSFSFQKANAMFW
jgi:hypothetical protein